MVREPWAITTLTVTMREPGAITTSTVTMRESWISSTESSSEKSVRGRFSWTREGLGLDKKQKNLRVDLTESDKVLK